MREVSVCERVDLSGGGVVVDDVLVKGEAKSSRVEVELAALEALKGVYAFLTFCVCVCDMGLSVYCSLGGSST